MTISRQPLRAVAPAAQQRHSALRWFAAAATSAVLLLALGVVTLVTTVQEGPQRDWWELLRELNSICGVGLIAIFYCAMMPAARAGQRIRDEVRLRALAGDSATAPLAVPQPQPLTGAELPAGTVELGFSLGPLSGAADMAILGGWFIALVGACVVIAGMYGLFASTGDPARLAKGVVILAGLGAIGGGLWLTRWGRRNGRGVHLVGDESGLKMLMMGTERELVSLRWADAHSFTVATTRFPDSFSGRGALRTIQHYRLDSGASCLDWRAAPDDDATVRTQHDLLNRLTFTRTGLPLRDLTPVYEALAARQRALLGHRRAASALDTAPTQEQPGVDDAFWQPVQALPPTTRWFVMLAAADFAAFVALALVVLAVHMLVR